MSNFILNNTLNINLYIVKLYNIDSESIDINDINNALQAINAEYLPNQIIDILQSVNGVSKIEIYDDNNTLLINSEKFLPI